MFDKLKQLKNISRLRGVLAKQKETVEEEGVAVTLNGKLEIEDIKLNTNLDIKKQEEVLKNVFNQAVKKIQIDMAQKMSHMS